MASATQSPRLDVPVHFVCSDEKLWPELKGDPTLPLPTEVQVARSGGAINSWIVQVYHWMRAAGETVTIGGKTRADAVNIVSTWDFGRRNRKNTHYILAVRADAHAPMMANFVVYQNDRFSPAPHRAMMKHLPQPGIVPRNPDREDRIRTLSYMGRARNLLPGLQTPAFKDALAEIGVTLDLRFDDKDTGRHAWNDYSEVDAIVAVRGRGGYLESLKPGSKLVNAWLAGVPAILGPEAGFEDLRMSDLDYVEAHTPEDVIEAVKAMNATPERYAAIVANGKNRAVHFTAEAIAQDWVSLINGRVAPRFKAWHARPEPLRWLSVAWGLFAEPLAKRMHRHNVRRGQKVAA